MFKKVALLSGFGIAALGFSQETFAAVKVGVLGAGGYETIRFSKDLDMNGFGLGAGAQVNAVDLTGGTDLLVGAALKYYSVSAKVNSVDFSLSQFIFAPYLGLSVKANPKFTLEATLGYDFGLSGKYAYKQNGTEVSKDTKSYSSITHEWRGLFNVTQQLGVGLGLAWQAGTVEVPLQTKNNETAEADFRGFAVRALVGYTF